MGYETPKVTVFEVIMEQVVAASNTLEDYGDNPIYIDPIV